MTYNLTGMKMTSKDKEELWYGESAEIETDPSDINFISESSLIQHNRFSLLHAEFTVNMKAGM